MAKITLLDSPTLITTVSAFFCAVAMTQHITINAFAISIFLMKVFF
jgi:hypothetical protein